MKELRMHLFQFMKYCEVILRDDKAPPVVQETVSSSTPYVTRLCTHECPPWCLVQVVNALSDLLLIYGPQLRKTAGDSICTILPCHI